MLDHHLAGYAPVPTEQGESGGLLTRCVAPHRPARYLKQGTGAVAEDIAAEYLRLRWLQGRLPRTAIVAYASEGNNAALLTTAVPGVTAYEALTADPSGAPALIEALAATLRTLHALPVESCPFDASLPVRLAAARARVHAELVDEDDFGDLHTGWSASQVLAARERDLAGGLPYARVVKHGDFSLGNVLVHDWRVTGLSMWGGSVWPIRTRTSPSCTTTSPSSVTRHGRRCGRGMASHSRMTPAAWRIGGWTSCSDAPRQVPPRAPATAAAPAAVPSTLAAGSPAAKYGPRCAGRPR